MQSSGSNDVFDGRRQLAANVGVTKHTLDLARDPLPARKIRERQRFLP